MFLILSCTTDKKSTNNNLCQELKSKYLSLGSPQKIILVLSSNWVSPHATLSFWQKLEKNIWKKQEKNYTVSIGRNGLGLGDEWSNYKIGLNAPIKKEGDGKTPLGLFLLGRKFGKQPAEIFNQQENYLLLNQGTECVDDVESPYYNQIVETTQGNLLVTKNWKSSEAMMKEPLYDQGITVNYQSSASRKAGSCIFIHLEDSKKTGTSGCIAMDKKLLDKTYTFAANFESVELIIATEKFFQEYKTCLLVD